MVGDPFFFTCFLLLPNPLRQETHSFLPTGFQIPIPLCKLPPDGVQKQIQNFTKWGERVGDTGNETRSAFFSNTELVGKTCKVGGGGWGLPNCKEFPAQVCAEIGRRLLVFVSLTPRWLCLTTPPGPPTLRKPRAQAKREKKSPINLLPGSSSAAICFLPTIHPPPRPPRLLRVPDPYPLFSDRQHRRPFRVSGARLPSPTTLIRNSWELIRT